MDGVFLTIAVCRCPAAAVFLSPQLLIQDVGLDSVALATLVMEGALGKGGADRSRTEACQWYAEGVGWLIILELVPFRGAWPTRGRCSPPIEIEG